MLTPCESPLAVAMVQKLPNRLQAHSYSLLELAVEMAQEFDCPLCEILTPLGEALTALAAVHQIKFDGTQKQVMLA